MITKYELFSSSVSSLSRDIQAIERTEMAKFGLKGPHAQYLIAMNRFPEGVTAAQLSGICEKDKAAVSRAISDMFKQAGNALPTPALIISQVCKFYSIEESVMRGTLKNKGTNEARQIAIYLIRKLTNLSTPDIGKELNKDHSTILYSINKINDALNAGDEELKKHIRDITANINIGILYCDIIQALFKLMEYALVIPSGNSLVVFIFKLKSYNLWR